MTAGLWGLNPASDLCELWVCELVPSRLEPQSPANRNTTTYLKGLW